MEVKAASRHRGQDRGNLFHIRRQSRESSLEAGSPWRKAIGKVHTGEQYHEFMLASRRDRQVRENFRNLALGLLPAGAELLDFGAGTGIDAKVYAASGHRTFVHEPSQAMLDCLLQHCRDEIARKTVVPVARPLTHEVHAVTANFAVLNHIVDQPSLFEECSRVVGRGGFFLVSMLSPWYLGDARHRWWWANLANLVRSGSYPSPGESRIHRFAPGAVARAAAPHFRLERLVPRGFGLATSLYMFLLFRRV
jgi:SAM-dependent methyltransferase